MAAQPQTTDQAGATIPLPPSVIAAQPPPTAASPLGRLAMGGASAIPASQPQQLPQPSVQPVNLTSSQPIAAAGGGDSLANLISSGHIDNLVNTIIAQEGGSPRGVENNPGNIKFTGAPGQIDSGVQALDGGTFASYQTPEEGRGAIDTLIVNAAKGHLPAYGSSPTVQSFLQTYQGKRMSPGMVGNLQQVAALTGQREQEALQGSLAEINALQQRYAKVAGSAAPGSDEENAALARQMELSERAADTFDKLASAPPKFTPLSMMQKMGSLATVIAVLGGLKSRQPATAGLNAAGEAMKALNQGNYDQYKIAYDQWKTQSELTVQSLRAHAEAINQILSNKRLSQEEKNSELNALAALTQNAYLKAGLEQKGAQFPFETATKLQQLANQQQALTNQGEKLNVELQKNQVQMQHMALQNKVLEAQLGAFGGGEQTPDVKPWAGMPNEPPPGRDRSAWENALVYVKTEVKPPLGWGNSVQRLEFNADIPLARKALGVTPETQGQVWIDYHAQQRRMASIESSFGGGMNGRNLISLNTVADHLDLLRQYADALKNKDLVAENHIINTMATQAGMPQVIQFALARTITGDEVVRLLTTTGGTYEDRQGIQKILSEYASPAQLEAAIDTASNYVRGRYEPLRQQFARGDKEREKYFEQNMMTPEAERIFSGTQKPVAGLKFHVGQIITGSDGRQYKVTGGDLTKDPDIEPVQ